MCDIPEAGEVLPYSSGSSHAFPSSASAAIVNELRDEQIRQQATIVSSYDELRDEVGRLKEDKAMIAANMQATIDDLRKDRDWWREECRGKPEADDAK